MLKTRTIARDSTTTQALPGRAWAGGRRCRTRSSKRSSERSPGDRERNGRRRQGARLLVLPQDDRAPRAATRGARVAGAHCASACSTARPRKRSDIAIVAAFRNQPGPHVVLASEIAAEGLDFEFANVMVNYDLPWNPMRVEQRIGRLDRYGQTARCRSTSSTSPSKARSRSGSSSASTPIGIFEAAIGDLESILGDEIGQLTQDLLRPGLTPARRRRSSLRAENIVVAGKRASGSRRSRRR